MTEHFFTYYESPVGLLMLCGDSFSITGIVFLKSQGTEQPRSNEIIRRCHDQLDEYFAGQRKDFDLPLNPTGTEFQKLVWTEVNHIPYGGTTTYLTIARILGNEKLTRAVGLANGANPIPIIIPCHRVIGANGKLTGYGGGINRKRWLLQHELQHMPKKNNSLF